MKSDLHKVLHPIAGRAMLTSPAGQRGRVGTGGQGGGGGRRDASRSSGSPPSHGARIAVQEAQLGTGHAVAQAAPLLEGFAGDVLVLYGDVPLVSARDDVAHAGAATRRRCAGGGGPRVPPRRRAPIWPRARQAADGIIHKMVEYKDATAAGARGATCAIPVCSRCAPRDLWSLLGARRQRQFRGRILSARRGDAGRRRRSPLGGDRGGGVGGGGHQQPRRARRRWRRHGSSAAAPMAMAEGRDADRARDDLVRARHP